MAVELEISLGHQFLGERQAFYKGVMKSQKSMLLSTRPTDVKTSLDLELLQKFESLGGYDLGVKATGLKFVWLDSRLISWYVLLTGSFDSKQIEQSLRLQSWSQEVDGFSKGRLRLRIVAAGVVIFSGLDGAVMEQVIRGSQVDIPDWGSIRIHPSLFEQLRLREPRTRAVLGGVQEFFLKWQGSNLSLRLDFMTAGQAALVAAVLGGFKSWLGVRLEEFGSPQVRDFSLLDSLYFSQKSALAAFVLDRLSHLEVESGSNFLGVKIAELGSPVEFLSEEIPRLLVAFLALGGGASISQFGDIAKIAPKVKTGVEGLCPETLRMVRKAMEFYSLDHGGSFRYESVKSYLFSEGYLPPDLSCNGVHIQDSQVFGTGPEGLIELRLQ